MIIRAWLVLAGLAPAAWCSRPHSARHGRSVGVEEDFQSLATNLDQYADLLNTAKTAEQVAEDAAAKFAVENPKDFVQYQQKAPSLQSVSAAFEVQSAAQHAATLLEKANAQLLKEDEETPHAALQEAEREASTE
ncbi:unnamed protein product [Effrenium voratum]|nr:unnamed protein product [Effrenium voratum]